MGKKLKSVLIACLFFIDFPLFLNLHQSLYFVRKYVQVHAALYSPLRCKFRRFTYYFANYCHCVIKIGKRWKVWEKEWIIITHYWIFTMFQRIPKINPIILFYRKWKLERVIFLIKQIEMLYYNYEYISYSYMWTVFVYESNSSPKKHVYFWVHLHTSYMGSAYESVPGAKSSWSCICLSGRWRVFVTIYFRKFHFIPAVLKFIYLLNGAVTHTDADLDWLTMCILYTLYRQTNWLCKGVKIAQFTYKLYSEARVNENKK